MTTHLNLIDGWHNAWLGLHQLLELGKQGVNARGW
jgi:hypothetical protein